MGVGNGKQGWIEVKSGVHPVSRHDYALSYPILRSPYSNKLIDVSKTGGVWENGAYNGQKVRLIFMPTLNNHGWGSEDYAGVTSAVKCHIGFQNGTTMHSVGYSNNHPDSVGEVVGELLSDYLAPAFYLTVAHYSVHISRTDPDAACTKTVGLCTDPVTLDYWMCKYVLYPCNNAPYFNPDNNNNSCRNITATGL